jgi:glycerol uptake facilitator-like aquaporin
MWVCLYEMLGTCLLIISLNWSMFLYNSFFSITPIAMGVALTIIICIWGDISGGHVNPAVTLGVFFSRKGLAKNAGFAIMIIFS